MANLKTFISKTTIVFKTFDFSVKRTINNSEIWNFSAISPNGDKKYVVYCAPDISKAKGIVKIALKKTPAGHRLVVVCENHESQDLQDSTDDDYCLVTFDKLNEYGVEMLDIIEKEGGLTPIQQKFTSALG